MPVNLSIKNAPDDVVASLKARAIRNHRSLQGELMAILEEVAREKPKSQARTIEELSARIRAIGHPSPSEAVQMVREDRDSGHR